MKAEMHDNMVSTNATIIISLLLYLYFLKDDERLFMVLTLFCILCEISDIFTRPVMAKGPGSFKYCFLKI